MNPIVTVWPDKATESFSTHLVEKLIEDGFDGSSWSNVDYDDTVSDRLPQLLQSALKQLIRLDSPVTTLNVLAIVPVIQPGCVQEVARLADVIAALPGNYALCVLCLLPGVAGALDAASFGRAAGEISGDIRAIASTLASQPYSTRSVVIDDYIVTGAPINFNEALLARFVSALIRTMAENYDSLLPNVTGASSQTMLAMGLSQAKFDRKAAAGYLLDRAMAAAIESAGLSDGSVNIQEASSRAQQYLDGVDVFYDKVYNDCVVPMIEDGKTEDDIVEALPSQVESRVDGLKRDVTVFLDDCALTLPEKEATFALLIGCDNERLTSYLYMDSGKEFDDALTKPLDIYIDSYNSFVVFTGLLPGRGECRFLKLPDIHLPGGVWPNAENRKACNPLPKMKKLRIEMQDQMLFARDKTEEFKQLLTMAQWTGRRDQVLRRCDYDVVEQPLNDIYEPQAGLNIKRTVDMRDLCSPVRDQGDLGSCSSFAATAMYEIIVNAANPAAASKADLSERYLFYHSNVLTGKPDGGSNFRAQLEVLGSHGICAERLYRYTTDVLTTAPTAEAHADAEKHRVVLAKEIKLRHGGSKYDDIKENRRLLTSALSEGYAVGIALALYDNFGKEPGGLVSLPDTNVNKFTGHHAMVIVGYSEEGNCYIVRNSWGVNFGDRGYCYISRVYVEDPEFAHFACIIAQTTETTTQIVNVPSPLVVNLGPTQIATQIVVASNAIDEANTRYGHLRECYDAIFTYFTQLRTKLQNPSTRRKIDAASREWINEELARKEGELRNLRAQMEALSMRQSPGCLGMLIPWRRQSDSKGERKELQARIDAVEAEIQGIESERLKMRIKFYMAGILADEIFKVKLDLEERYNFLVNYNKNLTQWHGEYKGKAEEFEAVDDKMFLNLIDRDALEAYFGDKIDGVSGAIDLPGEFMLFTTDTPLKDIRDKLELKGRAALGGMFADFSMCDYLLRLKSYPYLYPPDNLFGRLGLLAKPAVQCIGTADFSGMLTISHDPKIADTLREAYKAAFAAVPVLLDTSDADSVTVIVTMPVAIDAIKV